MFKNWLAIPDKFYTDDGRRLSVLAYLFLLMLCFGFFSAGLATLPPTDRDESSFAQASKQMIESGNYTDIRLQDAPRYKKPIGIYWLQSASVRLFDPDRLNEIWAYRLPSFAGATIAILMTAALGTLLFNPATGLMAGMMLAACVLLNIEARLAKTDAALLASIMIAMYGLVRAYVGQAAGWRIPLMFWTTVVVGVLIKGPIIILPILAVLLWLKISDKNIIWFRALRPLIGIPYALLLIAPWFIAIMMQSHGAFMQQSAGQDMLAKLWQGQNRGIMPPGMHLLALPLAFFPASLLVVFALPDMWKNRRDSAVKFCIGWILPTWIVFELSLTKLPHYVLPTYPALAILTAKFLYDGLPSLMNARRRLPTVLIIALWVVIGMGLSVALLLTRFAMDKVMDVPLALAGFALVTTMLAALLALPSNKIGSLTWMIVGSLIFTNVVFGHTLPQSEHSWLSREIVQAADDIKPCPDSRIITFGYDEPSLVFLAGTDTILSKNADETAQAMQGDKCLVAVIDHRNQSAFLDAFSADAPHPVEKTSVTGLNSGHGSFPTMDIFVMPELHQ